MPKYLPHESRQWVRDNFAKYFTVLYMAFLPDGEIDEESLKPNVELTLSLPVVGGVSPHSIHQEFWMKRYGSRSDALVAAS